MNIISQKRFFIELSLILIFEKYFTTKMVSESLPNICTQKDCFRTRNPCEKPENTSCSLHDDIHNVIDTMGPPTPMYPLDVGSESADDTIPSNFSENTLTNSTNTSFVEVLIKNHHKNKKSKIFEVSPKKNKSSIILNNAGVQTDIQTPKEVHFQDCASSASTYPVYQKLNEKLDIKFPSGITTNGASCPHAPCPSFFNQAFSNNSPYCTEEIKNPQDTKVFYSSCIGKSNSKDQHSNVSFKQNSSNRGYNKNHNTQQNKFDCNYSGMTTGVTDKAELYYFDHGNAAYYNTTDCPPAIRADYLAEKTEMAATKFWAQVFGGVNVVISLITSFILQLVRFVLFSLVRPLTVGLIQLFSDYFLKPLLATLFNGLIQPPLIFLFNILTSIRDIFEPIAHSFGFFFKEISVIFRSFRLVEVRKIESCRTV